MLSRATRFGDCSRMDWLSDGAAKVAATWIDCWLVLGKTGGTSTRLGDSFSGDRSKASFDGEAGRRAGLSKLAGSGALSGDCAFNVWLKLRVLTGERRAA